LQIAAYPGEPLEVLILPHDEQYFATSESFRILENSGEKVSHINIKLISLISIPLKPCIIIVMNGLNVCWMCSFVMVKLC